MAEFHISVFINTYEDFNIYVALLKRVFWEV